MIQSIALDLKLPACVPLKIRQNEPREQRQNRRKHHKAAHDQCRELRNQPGVKICPEDGDEKDNRNDRQNQRSPSEELERPVIPVQTNDHAEYPETVRESVEF